MQKIYKLTKERYDALEQELHYLKTVREKEVAEQIKEARSFGDLSENSEYDEAKNEQGKLYSRMAEIQDILDYAIVIDEESVPTDTVKPGCLVLISNTKTNEELEYQLVGSQEANPLQRRISDESPLGRALLVDIGMLRSRDGPAQHGLDPGHQFARAERFADVVVGAKLQTDDTVDFVAPGGQHDDRWSALLAQLATDLKAIDAGQHQVEDHKGHTFVASQAESRLPVGGFEDRISLALQVRRDQAADVRLVINDQNRACQVRHVTTPP
jgi:transcription elongation factor GreA